MDFNIDNLHEKELFDFFEKKVHEIDHSDIVLATEVDEFIWGDTGDFVEEGTPVGIEVFKSSPTFTSIPRYESRIILFKNIYFKTYSE